MFFETLRKKKGVLHKVRYSIRTRYSLATGFFLLAILGLFYVGGRIVLVHLVKDAEEQVKRIGTDINRLADRNASVIRRHLESLSSDSADRPVRTQLGLYNGIQVALALRLSADGRFSEGYMAGGHAGEALRLGDVEGYEKQFMQWTESIGGGGALPAGPRWIWIFHPSFTGIPVPVHPLGDKTVIPSPLTA